MRKLIGFVFAMAIVAFAAPSFGQVKIFSIQTSALPATPPAIPALTPVTITWSNALSNGTLSGNSVINSIRLDTNGLTWQVDPAHPWCTTNGTTSTCGAGQLSSISTGLQIANITGVKPGGTFTLNLLVSGTPSCAQVPKGYAWTGNTWGGNQFGPASLGSDVATSYACMLGCPSGTTYPTAGNLDPFADTIFMGSPDWGLVRVNNAFGTCTPLAFTFVQSGTNTAFVSIKPPDQVLAVEYVVQWPPVSPDAAPASTAGWTDKRPKLAWGFAAQPPLSQYSPALACVCDLSDITNSTSACYNNPNGALPVIPNVEPFITLSKPVAQGGQGLTQYAPGTKASMCVSQHAWSTLPDGTIQYWDKIVDESDGWTNQ